MSYVDRLNREQRVQAAQDIGIRVTVATDATDSNDDVMVTFDGDDPPRSRVLVDWKPRLSEDGALARVYPQRGDEGIVIITDEGPPWLIW